MVVLPASGCEIMANVRRLLTASASCFGDINLFSFLHLNLRNISTILLHIFRKVYPCEKLQKV
ncbi:hypothetical protein GCM10011459_19920 [Limosilactobacillus caviae]|uniref:Uncharacterized protein n=1 Tax=Limosilactobacillus caviae TaxID=1769424 RepID=A0ABQ2C702_9LACO|nr:hypothetical protein GCM10011459_19920 [Limosilactobacillus caviae]